MKLPRGARAGSACSTGTLQAPQHNDIHLQYLPYQQVTYRW